MITEFTVGIKSLTNEFVAMQSSGFYWLCVTHEDDARHMSQQVLKNQPLTSPISIVQMAEAEEDHVIEDPVIFSLIQQRQTTISYYALPGHIKALQGLMEDLRRAQVANNSLILLKIPAEIPLRMGAKDMARWITTLNAYLAQRQSTLVILSHGVLNHVLEKTLLPYHRQLHGLVRISDNAEGKRYHIRWWANHIGMVANEIFNITFPPHTEEIEIKPISNVGFDSFTNTNDAHLYYATQDVLEGAPPLSDHWRLFATNELLAESLQGINAATIIFAIDKSHVLADLATQVYKLRQSRGHAIKIVVRELMPCLRYHDEYALLACGVNLIVPYSESFSSFLTRLESVQDMIFQRTLTKDLTGLLANLRPTEQMGLMDFPLFNNEIVRLIKNPHGTRGSKGVLIALQPVMGLSPLQALSLCRFRRGGDLALCTNEQLYLFLSACRMNDVEMVLVRLFNLPVKDVFVNQVMWDQDQDILNELARLKSQPMPRYAKNNNTLAKEMDPLTQSSVMTKPSVAERVSPFVAPLILQHKES